MNPYESPQETSDTRCAGFWALPCVFSHTVLAVLNVFVLCASIDNGNWGLCCLGIVDLITSSGITAAAATDYVIHRFNKEKP